MVELSPVTYPAEGIATVTSLEALAVNPVAVAEPEPSCRSSFPSFAADGTVMSTAPLASGVRAALFTLTPWMAESANAPCAAVAKSDAFLPESTKFPDESRDARLPVVAPETLVATPLRSELCKAVSALSRDVCTAEDRSVEGIPPLGLLYLAPHSYFSPVVTSDTAVPPSAACLLSYVVSDPGIPSAVMSDFWTGATDETWPVSLTVTLYSPDSLSV